MLLEGIERESVCVCVCGCVCACVCVCVCNVVGSLRRGTSPLCARVTACAGVRACAFVTRASVGVHHHVRMGGGSGRKYAALCRVHPPARTHARALFGSGDHFVTIKVDIPTTVSAADKELLMKLKEGIKDSASAGRGFFSK